MRAVETGGALRTAAVVVLLSAVAGGPTSGQSGGAEKADRLMARAGERYGALQGFCAEFTQERIVPLLDQRTISRGTLCQRQPGYFLMDFSDPEGDVVVADGEQLWTYFPSVDPGRVIRSELGGAGGRTFNFHDEFLSEPEARFDAGYEGTDTVTGRPTHVLSLRPRRDAGYVRARIWLGEESGLIRKVELVEENDSLRRITLSGIRLNPGLEPERFRFVPPTGIQVISR
ncbi:MAG: outer membrane lipoprotein-sorting protein [Gemmatimonadetes bacterium]|nr:outer membrane lipoprotein carrier protein LolA [Gemmatimonadota bacterium]NIR79460.1 outer membrane lipoprotein carrier protein LolA [Gemmatimonadota bacterium]NIT88131.1 outer membrane lipoprotein carrier protein LolA [Gemmatimonadota bacterium]NIU31952.1 outer membrane lipoprotein carrier protein LolA [Gemmatimonadota bacterium]NIU36566.1 outer membrane lipoprotein-sorting protein [Gemmatimonadota bacterium]